MIEGAARFSVAKFTSVLVSAVLAAVGGTAVWLCYEIYIACLPLSLLL